MSFLLNQQLVDHIRAISELGYSPIDFPRDNVYKTTIETVRFEDTDVQETLEHIYRIFEKGTLFLETIHKKKMQLYTELLNSLQSDNYVWISDGIRTFFEVLGTEAYFAENIYTYSKRIDQSKSIVNIKETLNNVENYLNKVLMTTAIKDFKLPNIDSKYLKKANLSTKTLLESYCSYFDGPYEEAAESFLHCYKYFSEIIHPSFSGTMLGMVPTVEALSYYDLINAPKYKKLQQDIGALTRYFYETVNEALQFLLAPPPNMEVKKIHSTFIYRYIVHAEQNPAISFAQLFRLDPANKLRVVGDGKSKETAFHVINAMSHEEEFVSLAAIINERHLKERQTDYDNMIDGLYETHINAKGETVWFKYNLDFVKARGIAYMAEIGSEM